VLALKRAGREYALTQRVLAYEQELPTIDNLLARPAWYADAACRERPTAMFFPARGDAIATAAAAAVCAGCLVLEECRAWSIDQDATLAGVWGGLGGQQRRLARAGQPAELTPRPERHGTEYLYRGGCRCDPCREANASGSARRRKARRAPLGLVAGACSGCGAAGDELYGFVEGLLCDRCWLAWQRHGRPAGAAFEAWSAERRAFLAMAG
jgi:WhiB family transcriptional regulator, redox-sensing transcriptional regulator